MSIELALTDIAQWILLPFREHVHFCNYGKNVIDMCGGSDLTVDPYLTSEYTHILDHKNTRWLSDTGLWP